MGDQYKILHPSIKTHCEGPEGYYKKAWHKILSFFKKTLFLVKPPIWYSIFYPLAEKMFLKKIIWVLADCVSLHLEKHILCNKWSFKSWMYVADGCISHLIVVPGPYFCSSMPSKEKSTKLIELCPGAIVKLQREILKCSLAFIFIRRVA